MEESGLCIQHSLGNGSKPQGSKVVLKRSRGNYLYVENPPPGWNGIKMFFLIFLLICFCLCAFGMVSFAPMLIDQSGLSIPFWTLSSSCLLVFIFAVGFISKSYTRQFLHIGRQTYGVWTERRFSKGDTETSCQEEPNPSRALGRTRNLNLAVMIPARKVKTNDDGTEWVGPCLQIREGIRKREFGDGLTVIELEWILKEVNEAIGELTEAEQVGSTVSKRAGIVQFCNQDDLGIGRKPPNSRVILRRNRQHYFYAEIPSDGWTWGLTAIIVVLLIVISPFTVLLVISASQWKDIPAMAITLLICSPSQLTGFGLMAYAISRFHTREVLHIGRQRYGVWEERSFCKADIDENWQKEPDPSKALGATRNLNMAALIPAIDETTAGPHIEIREGIKKKTFGHGLELNELEWIIKKLNKAIAELTRPDNTSSPV